jgi:hypothetical protein
MAGSANIRPALHGEDVDVLVGDRFHGLLVKHLGQRTDLVSQLGRLLELQLFGVLHHPRLECRQHRLRVTAQESLGVVHVVLVVLR